MLNLERFKKSVCYTCGYCKERKLQDETELDVRWNGAIKIWCYLINDVELIQFDNCLMLDSEEDYL